MATLKDFQLEINGLEILADELSKLYTLNRRKEMWLKWAVMEPVSLFLLFAKCKNAILENKPVAQWQ